jgi:tetratricopeptide (TPR) repeat protein
MADVYMSRGLLDLARDEYRAITRLEPGNLTAGAVSSNRASNWAKPIRWPKITFRSPARSKKPAMWPRPWTPTRRSSRFSQSHRGPPPLYRGFRQTGPESELVDHYLILADALVAINQIDEAIAIYSQVMTIDPVNETARKKLADTQARRAGMFPPPPTARPRAPVDRARFASPPGHSPARVTEPAQTLLPSADDLLAQAFGEIEGEALHTAPTPRQFPLEKRRISFPPFPPPPRPKSRLWNCRRRSGAGAGGRQLSRYSASQSAKRECAHQTGGYLRPVGAQGGNDRGTLKGQ